ncbi:MAG: hypothetical protein HYW45_03860 [Candidatus Daviesbacteria bacterium]|nr:MAG: hypothetical protein HYW45_03860 [Candidatus Daviesbacteria bacterium]
MILVILLRITLPLLILRWPLIGGLLSIFLDYIDFNILQAFDPGKLILYQNLDKVLDLHYLTLEFIVALTWRDKLVKKIASSLFFYRIVGVILFEITQAKQLLFFFPNLFEFFFLFYLIYQKFWGEKLLWSRKLSTAVLILLFLFKIYQEFSLHLVNYQPWLGSQVLGIGK